MAVNTNNPPGRLHDIFRRAREAGDASPAFIWSRAFGLNEKDVLALIKRLLDVLLVVDETEKGFKKFPNWKVRNFLSRSRRFDPFSQIH